MKTLLIIAIIFYSLKYIGRFAFPYMMKRFVGKMENKMRQQQDGFQKPEDINIGETVIDKKTKETTSNKEVGEYVDYEDID